MLGGKINRFLLSFIKVGIPRKVRGFRLIKSFRNGAYLKAYYKKGSKYGFAKIWQGFIPDYNSIALTNEYNFLKNIKFTDRKVTVPDLYSLSKHKRTEILLLKKYNLKKSKLKYGKYRSIKSYLQKIGESYTSIEKSMVFHRGSAEVLRVYLFSIFASILNNSMFAWKIITGAYYIVKNYKEIKLDKKLVLSHRDLHDKNIAKIGSKDLVLDFGLAGFTNSIYADAYVCVENWGNDKLTYPILKKYIKSLEFHLYLVIASTHLLSGKNYSSVRITKYSGGLDYALKHLALFKLPGAISRLKGFMYLFTGFRPRYVTKNVANVNGYKLRRLYKSSHKRFYVGEYSKEGKIYIGKICFRSKDSMDYAALRQEIFVYLNFKNKFAPELSDIVSTSDHLGFFVKYEDKNRKKISYFEYEKLAKKIISHMRTINIKNVRSNYGGIYYILRAPIYILMALYGNKNRKQILKIAAVFCKNIHHLFKASKYVFVHGDLYPRNILVYVDSLKLIDYEQSTVTFPEFELATLFQSGKIPMRTKIKLYDHFSGIESFDVNRFNCLYSFCLLSVYAFVKKVDSDKIRNFSQKFYQYRMNYLI